MANCGGGDSLAAHPAQEEGHARQRWYFRESCRTSKRVAELKAAQAQKSELSRDQLRDFLTEVILTPAGKVSKHSRLCQSYKVTSSGTVSLQRSTVKYG
jgi:hypothetical protein